MDPLNEVNTDNDGQAVSSPMNTLNGKKKILSQFDKYTSFFSLIDESSSNTTQSIISNDTNEQDNIPLECMLYFFSNKLI